MIFVFRVGDIPFLWNDLSFYKKSLPKYKILQDNANLKINGTYFKTKDIITYQQRVDLTGKSHYRTSLFPKCILSYSSTVSHIDTSSTHMVGLHYNYYSFGELSQNVHSKNSRGDNLTTCGWSLAWMTQWRRSLFFY